MCFGLVAASDESSAPTLADTVTPSHAAPVSFSNVPLTIRARTVLFYCGLFYMNIITTSTVRRRRCCQKEHTLYTVMQTNGMRLVRVCSEFAGRIETNAEVAQRMAKLSPNGRTRHTKHDRVTGAE